MNERINAHTKINIILTIVGIGLGVESITQRWEFWFPPLLLLGIVILWVVHVSQYGDIQVRELFMIVLCFAAALFHGVHVTSFFDIAIANLLLTSTLSLLGSIPVLNATLVEYVSLLIIQLSLAGYYGSVELNTLNLSRLILHNVIVFSCHYVSRWSILDRKRYEDHIAESDEIMKSSLIDMDDFLVNISHELRTPVNVVNGISSLILKNEDTEDIQAIKDAGLRLSRQIEDIQDYTEIKQGHVLVENEKYLITSLVNDVIANLHIQEETKNLEFIVDLDPKVPAAMKGDIRKLHKILRHLIDNAIKFTKAGGVYIRITANHRDYGVNLCLEVTDTGIGMSRQDVANASKRFYQANKKRNRSSGGIGLGLNIVYGFVHEMKGFVTITSEKGKGTCVRISIPQEVMNRGNCLSIDRDIIKNVVFHVMPGKYKDAQVRDFYRRMAVNIASGLKLNLYSAVSIEEVKNLMEKLEVSHIFMGADEYAQNPEVFDKYAEDGIIVAVSAPAGFKKTAGSRVIIMPKPLYGFPVTKVLNGESDLSDDSMSDRRRKPMFEGVKALIVDDEPMNLVVASGMFKEYGMTTETAASGQEAIDKFRNNHYDVIFMDHMMPEMDGVEAMQRIKQAAKDMGGVILIVALTANAVSGAREMFIKEGFDGFIAKPIDVMEFERVMKRILPDNRITYVERSGS
ncbi:MAG: response regulator [Butyrivibrio sp.]|nr:response regulator [Butyrivibrio sp.]